MDMYNIKWTSLGHRLFSQLCRKAGEKQSQRDLARALKMSPTAIANALKDLKPFVKMEKTKNINFITLNRDCLLAINLKRAENLKEIYLSGLSEYLTQELAGGTIVLFGSYSRGDDIAPSDIDIAVVGRKQKPLSLERYEKILNKQISVQFYSSWKSIHEHLKNNILNGILLHGSVEL